MTDGRSLSVAAGTVAMLALLCFALLAFAPTAAAQDGTYVVEQGEQCIDVDAITDESQTVEEFYDYRNSYTEPSSGDYSSFGTTEYQQDNTSILMLYEGAEGTSLVVVHEKLHEDESEGTTGSSATFDVTGLSPDDDGWVVLDDDYDNQSDEYEHYDTYSEMDWVWSQSRTDGGAYRGLDGDFEVGVDPAFNEDADKRFDDSGYGGQVDHWKVVTATDDGFERVTLDSMDDPVSISPGGCEADLPDAPDANLTVGESNPEVGVTNVTLDASGSESPAEISEYRWDVTGDGSVDRTTDDAVVEHVFEETGQRDVSVTVVDEHDQTGEDDSSVDVTDDTPPTAAIDAPAEASVGEDLTFSGADSEDNHRIESYEWDLDDGTEPDGESVTHAYDAPGEYEVKLTVADPAGNEDVTNATVNVTEASEPSGPTAALDAPAEATVGEDVTLDAGDSDVGDDVDYEWFVDGASVTNTTAATYDHPFSEPGTYDLRVEVTDDDGNDSADATIEVEEPEPDLTADVEADPGTAEVGESITFDASGSDGDVASYDWDLGDGTTVADGNESIQHAYDAADEYVVELTVTNADGVNDTDTATVDVDTSDGSDPATGPTAKIDVPDEVPANETVPLDASGSEVGENASYDWIIGGVTKNGPDEPTWDRWFSNPGTYNVTVKITDDGGTDSAETTLVMGEPLVAKIDAPDSAEKGEKITLNGSSSTGDISEYRWVLDDGTKTTEETITHTYEKAGTYDIALNVSHSAGYQDWETDVPIEVVEDSSDDENDDSDNSDGSDGSDDSGNSGSSGGSSGGSAAPPSDSEDSEDTVEPTVDVENGTLVVTATDVASDDSIVADVPSNDTVGSTALELRSAEIETAADAENLTVSFEPADRDVPGRFARSPAFVPNSTAELETVTYEFGVDNDTLSTAGVSLDNLTAYADDGEWEAIETDVEPDGDRVLASVTVQGDDPVGVGAEGSVLYLSELETDGAVTNGTINLVATARNTGTEAGEWTVPFGVGDANGTEETVSLDAGEETTVETTLRVPDGDDVDVRVGSTRRNLALISVTDLSVASTDLSAGESTTVEATLHNHGSAAGEFDAELVLADSVATVEPVALEPGESTTVTFDQRIESPGSYELAVGDATATVEVANDDGDDGDGDDADDGVSQLATEDGSGFGALVALGAVLLGVLACRRIAR